MCRWPLKTLKCPRTVVNIMCFTANVACECAGSISHAIGSIPPCYFSLKFIVAQIATATIAHLTFFCQVANYFLVLCRVTDERSSTRKGLWYNLFNYRC